MTKQTATVLGAGKMFLVSSLLLGMACQPGKAEPQSREEGSGQPRSVVTKPVAASGAETAKEEDVQQERKALPEDRGDLEATSETRETRAVLAVLDFDYRIRSGFAPGWTYRASVLTDKMNGAILASQRFRVVDRQRLDDLLNEVELGKQGVTSPATAVHLGQLLGVDYLLTGTIDSMGASVTSDKIPYTSRFQMVTQGSMGGDIRVTDARTGEIVASVPLKVTRKKTEVVDSARHGRPAQGFYSRLERKFALRVASTIVDEVYPPRVVRVEPNGFVWIDRGQGTMFSPGKRVSILSRGEVIRDPDSGRVLGAPSKKVGSAVIVAVEKHLCRARVENAQEPIVAKMKVRLEESHYSAGDSTRSQRAPTPPW